MNRHRRRAGIAKLVLRVEHNAIVALIEIGYIQLGIEVARARQTPRIRPYGETAKLAAIQRISQ